MKFRTTTLLFLFTIIPVCIAAQPASFNYQAILRNDAGQPMASEEVSIGIALLLADEKNTEVFSEVHNVQTNQFGLVNLQIGSVNSIEGIDWAAGDYFIEISVNGLTMGVSQLLSVPFAMHARTSGDSFSGNYDDLANAPDLSNFIFVEDPQNGDILYYADNQWHTLGIGEEGQLLGIQNGLPQWITPYHEVDSVIDIDGNIYHTTTIGNQQWLTSNLRTTKYNDGSPIQGGLSNDLWSTTVEGAYAVYPHEGVPGIETEQQMIDIYGMLYNYYAVMDLRGLCPAGWRVATRADYDELAMYVAYWGKGSEDQGEKSNSVAGNFLKSCRQVNSPLGGDCSTTAHPRWDANNNNHGTNSFGFDGLPGGRRLANGNFNNIGTRGYWWTSTELSFAMSYWRALWHDGGFAYSGFEYRAEGLSVRCIRIQD